MVSELFHVETTAQFAHGMQKKERVYTFTTSGGLRRVPLGMQFGRLTKNDYCHTQVTYGAF
jgi:hypothetical protein